MHDEPFERSVRDRTEEEEIEAPRTPRGQGVKRWDLVPRSGHEIKRRVREKAVA